MFRSKSEVDKYVGRLLSRIHSSSEVSKRLLTKTTAKTLSNSIVIT